MKFKLQKPINEFFSNVVKNLEILEYQCVDNLHSINDSNGIRTNSHSVRKQTKWMFGQFG